MSIVRERDYWQAKRRVAELETDIAITKNRIEVLKIDRDPGFQDGVIEEEAYLDILQRSLMRYSEIVAERESTQTRPCDVDRPANEASLDLWVSA